MKIIHTADWHWSEQNLAKCLQAVEFVINESERIRPDLHVIAGDFWDRRQVLSSSSAVNPAVEAMMKLGSIAPVVMVLGNHVHDAPGSLEVFRHLHTRYPVYVAENPQSVAMLDAGKGQVRFQVIEPERGAASVGGIVRVILHLLPYLYKSTLIAERSVTSIGESQELLARALRAMFLRFAAIGSEFGKPSILVAHCAVGEAKVSSGQLMLYQDVPLSISDLELIGASYCALGHVHLHQFLSPAISYSGSMYHLNFGEPENKYFNSLEIKDDQVTIEPVQIPSRPMVLHEARVSQETNTLIDLSDARDWSDAELRVRVQLSPEQAGLVSDEEIRQHYQGAFSVKIERIITPTERVRSEMISRARTLREKLLEWESALGKPIPAEALDLADEIEQNSTE